MKKNKIDINLKLKKYLKNLQEVSEALKIKVEKHNKDLLERLKKKGERLYEKISLRGW
ncbi:hypothetical protein [Fusobacterium ulcerans]|uniref:hypothetical protein n=1 Tax=Fusobacterium ulcerans TaxID=861 RepID=UPI0002478D41